MALPHAHEPVLLLAAKFPSTHSPHLYIFPYSTKTDNSFPTTTHMSVPLRKSSSQSTGHRRPQARSDCFAEFV